MHDDRRAHRRIDLVMWVDETHGECRYFHHSVNLSLGGILLGNTIPHPRGTKVRLQFALPGEAQPFDLRGETVGQPEVEHLGMHIKFVELDEPTERRLRQSLYGEAA